MEENKNKKKKVKKSKEDKKTNQEEAIEKAKKEMDELMKSIQEELGGNNVKVVQIQVPKANFKNFIIGFFLSLVLNNLFIVGTNGFFEFLKFDTVLDLVFFATYFTVLERILDFIFLKFFTPLIIRTMGLASFIPIVLSLAIVLIFPFFVVIKNVVVALIILVIIYILKTMVVNVFQNKMLVKKMRRKK